MSARTTREEARQRVMAAVSAALDRMIPLDEGVPLQGAIFLDFEDQVEAFGRQVLPTLLEERAALEGMAQVTTPGACPHCGSARVRWIGAAAQTELLSPHGKVVVPRRAARCRVCGRTFSPSGACVGASGGSSADAAGGAATGPRDGGTDV
jgi:hypothetical protein